MTRKAFTLTELSAVVVIIGILASISVPTYRRQVEKAEAVRLVSELRQTVTHFAAHYQQEGDFDGLTADGSKVRDADGKVVAALRVPEHLQISVNPNVVVDPDNPNPAVPNCVQVCLNNGGTPMACLQMCGSSLYPMGIQFEGPMVDLLALDPSVLKPIVF